MATKTVWYKNSNRAKMKPGKTTFKSYSGCLTWDLAARPQEARRRSPQGVPFAPDQHRAATATMAAIAAVAVGGDPLAKRKHNLPVSLWCCHQNWVILSVQVFRCPSLHVLGFIVSSTQSLLLAEGLWPLLAYEASTLAALFALQRAILGHWSCLQESTEHWSAHMVMMVIWSPVRVSGFAQEHFPSQWAPGSFCMVL